MTNSLQVATTTATTVVITPSSGWCSDSGLTLPVTFPVAVPATTPFYIATTGTFVVSAKVAGREYAGQSYAVEAGVTPVVTVPGDTDPHAVFIDPTNGGLYINTGA